MNSDIMENLNNKQKEAVINTDGPLLVIAGPGSGKTKVLTHRIAYLVEHKGINPKNILAVTFTNKAAQEMKERIKKLLGEAAEGVDAANEAINRDFLPSIIPLPVIGTFHSICVQILRQEAERVGYKKDFVIYDGDDQESLIKKSMEELQISPQQFNPKSVLSHISNAKNELKNPEEYGAMADGYLQENVGRIYELYQRKLKENSAFDFDDLIMKTIILFLDNGDILHKYQQKFKYILVDEYQDTNHAQYKLVDLLSKAHRNLCVVGDDWQSIYRWRGADIRNILEFEKNYPEARVVLLEQNYRSTQNILDGAYHIISKNINRKDKNLWTEKVSGHPIIVYEAANERGEAEFIVSEIARLTGGKEGKAFKLKDVAILYRTNAQSRSVEETFLQFNLPYRIVGGIKFYMRKEIKDIIAYMRFVLNPTDLVSLERIINVPIRGIGKKTFGKILAEARSKKKSVVETILDCPEDLVVKSKMEKLKKFASIIAECQKKSESLTVSGFLKYLLGKIAYQAHIQDGTEEGDRRWENVKELFSATEKYDKLSPKEGMKMFLEEVALATDLDNVDEKQDCVTLMTLHSAKGLEYDAVFIVGLEEGLLPHSRSLVNPSEMEEERRLCYVGITRAKTRVYLIFTRMRKIYGSIQANYPSRFLSDIPSHLFEHKEQDYGYDDEVSYLELD